MPFAPFPAFVLAPLVALVGPATAAGWEPVVNACWPTAGLALLWRLAGRLGVASLADRTWLLVLFGFSTATWWVTMRGGVWHTGQLDRLDPDLRSGCWRRSGGAGRSSWASWRAPPFLTRATLLAALPYWGWRSLPEPRPERLPAGLAHAIRVGARRAAWLALGFAPALAFALWYNAVRFGNPLESGYGLAALPRLPRGPARSSGSSRSPTSPMNLDYFLWHLGRRSPTFPWFKPDGLGMSVLLTSPGLLLAVRADWRSRETIALGLTALLVLVPSLLYYGGGWWQFGYRYALDASRS